MPELRALSRAIGPCSTPQVRRSSVLLGGQIVAMLIDDLDSNHYGLRIRVPEEKSALSRGKKKQTFRYYDVWVLSDDGDEPRPGFLDIVLDMQPKV